MNLAERLVAGDAELFKERRITWGDEGYVLMREPADGVVMKIQTRLIDSSGGAQKVQADGISIKVVGEMRTDLIAACWVNDDRSLVLSNGDMSPVERLPSTLGDAMFDVAKEFTLPKASSSARSSDSGTDSQSS